MSNDDEKLKQISDIAGASGRIIWNGITLVILLFIIGCLCYVLVGSLFS